jgi:hypothetical protein
MQMFRSGLVGLLALLFTGVLQAGTPDDPLNSVMWDYTRKIFLGDADYRFEPRIKLKSRHLPKILPRCRSVSMPVPLPVRSSALWSGLT